MEKIGNWSVTTHNCGEFGRKIIFLTKIYNSGAKNEKPGIRENSGKWPGNAGKFPGFWDNQKVTKKYKKDGILVTLFPGFPDSETFLDFPVPWMKFPGFPVSRFPGL